MAIDPKPFIHPFDSRALRTLEAMPGLKAILRKYIDLYEAKWSEGLYLSSFIRLSDNQLPELYELFKEVFDALEMEEEVQPRCYLEMDPYPDAYATGHYKKKFIVIKSGLVQLLSRRELKAVIAHECGHALCDHMIYKSLVRNVAQFGLNAFGLGMMLKPLLWAMLYWDRCSAFSCDRIAAFVMNDYEVVRDALIRETGGPYEITRNVNIEEYDRQIADLYNQLAESKYQSFLQLKVAIDQKYPFSAMRIKELGDWFNDPATMFPRRKQYDNLSL